MRYDQSDQESSNVEDRRSQGGGGGFGGGMQLPIPMGGRGGLSFTTMLIIGALMLLFGMNPLDLLRGGPGGGQLPPMPRMDPGAGGRSPFDLPGRKSTGVSPGEDAMKVFVGRVLKDTEDVWGKVFQQHSLRYREPKLVIFRGTTQTACGAGQSAMGPFYCPLDQKVYIDLQFYDDLRTKFGADGDFAQAYVVAHEVGHHVQTLLGIAEQVQRAKQSVGEVEANRIQVKMELQADCLAGFWAAHTHQAKNRLEPGDIEEGIRAAQAIGDDMIQRKQMGRVVPDAFTHGTSEQRTRWFMVGVRATQLQECDTFNASRL